MVGSALCQKLRDLGFLNLITNPSQTLDLRKKEDVYSFFYSSKPDYVFHLAAKVGGIAANIESPVEFLTDNLYMNTNVISASQKLGVKKLLFLGSSCIYPRNCAQPMEESDLLSGVLETTNEGYALSKICGLKLCEYYNSQYGTNYISLMPPNIFGVGDDFGANTSHVISALIRKFHIAKTEGSRAVNIWGTGAARREFLYVDDVVEGMVYFMSKVNSNQLNGFVNLGSNKDISIGDLAELVKDVIGYHGTLNYDQTKPDGMPKKLMDSSIAESLGWMSSIGLREGIEKTYRWYLEQAEHDKK
jgi:GDP-L-fucose synthase